MAQSGQRKCLCCGLFFDLDRRNRYVRLRTRMTVSDRRIQERIEKFQQPDVPIRVSRLIGLNQEDVQARSPEAGED